MGKGAGPNVQDTLPKVHEDEMTSSSIAVKNTFIEVGCFDEDIKLSRQMSEPAAPMKRVTSWSKALFPEEIPEDDAPQDPAGPEPEPDSKELDTPWARLVTAERWASPEPEALPMPSMQTAWMPPMPQAPMPEVHSDWVPGGMFMPQNYGAIGFQPASQPMFPSSYTDSSEQGLDPALAQESMSSKTVEKRRRRRAGGSLIDLAKKRMEERITAEAAARQHGAAPQPVPASSSVAIKNFCATCQVTAPCEFKFCHHCGNSLRPVQIQ